MSHWLRTSWPVIMLSLAAGCATPAPTRPPASTHESVPIVYAETRRQGFVEQIHGQPVRDPFRWLEDGSRPEVQAWMTGQDAVTRRVLAARPDRAAFARRLHELTYIDSIGTPTKRGSRYFYVRRLADKEKAIYCWKEGEKGEEHVLLDPNAMSADGTISVGLVKASHDGTKAAYTLRQRGEDAATLFVIDVASGKTSDVDRIEGARYAEPEWTPDNTGFYYDALPTGPAAAQIAVDQLPGYQEIRFHQLGTPASADVTVYPRTGDPARFLGVQLSRDGRWLLVSDLRGWSANDVYVRDLQDAGGTFRPLVKGREAQFSIAVWKNVFYILTNDGAPRWRVMRCDPSQPEPSHWRELVPERNDATIESVGVVGERLVATYLKNAANQIEIFELDGRPVRTVELPGIGVASGLVGNEDEDEAYFSFSSFTVPPQVYKTSVSGGATEVWAKIRVPVDPKPYRVDQVWYPSKDGTKISMFLVHRKDWKHDGNNPVLLTGYGGFNVPMTPYFSGALYAWLERGGVYAVANLRGGSEYGEDWHRAGMLGAKQNVFDDFIAASQWLIAQKVTNSRRLAISGGSNGGLLVGAAMTQRPDLYRAVVCAVPLLDMVRYHLFGSGRTWVDEYGSAEKADQFRWLYAYSPYHHVQRGTLYPAVLMLSADHDDRVDPMHARKMVAELQSAQPVPPAERPVLLRVETNAGHGGADLRRQAVEQTADEDAFLTWQLGM